MGRSARRGRNIMTQYVLVNRRAGKFTTEAKTASRAAVATTLARLGGNSRVVSDRDPADETARRVVVFDADAAQVAHLRTRLPADAILEPLVRRTLHRRTPIELAAASPMNGVALGGAASTYKVTIKGGGHPLSGIEVMFYIRSEERRVGKECRYRWWLYH